MVISLVYFGQGALTLGWMSKVHMYIEAYMLLMPQFPALISPERTNGDATFLLYAT